MKIAAPSAGRKAANTAPGYDVVLMSALLLPYV